MINSNVNVHVPVTNVHPQMMQRYSGLSNDEKQELIASLQYISPGIDIFIKNFYKSYSTTQTQLFLLRYSEEELINMFSSGLNLLITSLASPIPLDDYIESLNAKQPNFTTLIQNKRLFISSFMRAIIDTFQGNYNERLGQLWYKSVSNFIFSMNVILNR